ncbi:MAG: hypothetical protein JNG88_07470 [Phycisphaerales bacterium]|nr:hypothetical protein [Phycisphaerales bacterium]
MRGFLCSATLVLTAGLAFANPTKFPLETMEPAGVLQPIRMMKLDSHGRPVGDWIYTNQGGTAGGDPFSPCQGALIFDAAQSDPESGFPPYGGECVAAAGTRYFFGGAYNANVLVEDVRFEAPNRGIDVGAGQFFVFWDPPLPNRPLLLLVAMHDTFSFDCVLFPDETPAFWGSEWPADSPMWGFILDYGPQAPGAGYFVLQYDFCGAQPTPTPTDGEGAMTVAICEAITPATETSPLLMTGANHAAAAGNNATLASPKYMIWGFRDNGTNTPPNHIRPGHPDINNPPDEFTAWANDTNLETNPVFWDVAQQECFLLPALPAAACNFVDTEGAISLWAFIAPQIGACCIGQDCVADLQEQACIDAGGTYQGNGSVCDPNPCIPAPTGACCVGATCSITTQAACTGTYQGDGSGCTPNPCVTDPCGDDPEGDANCDNLVNNFDIDCFVAAVATGEANWTATCGQAGCDFLCVNDIDDNGVVNNFDIDPFVQCLTSSCP